MTKLQNKKETRVLKPTLEQKKIISAYSSNFNIKIEANAGCGKTSTCLFLADSNHSKQILLLTFNRQLADESKHKFDLFSHVSVQTVHGFVKGLYNQNGFDSSMLHYVFDKNLSPVKPSHFDVLILDEFQDFSPLMIKLIFKSLFFINPSAQLVILGSYFQCIYQYFDSDIRFLKLCDSLFSDNSRPWQTLSLTKSFRLTLQMQLFINSVILHQPHFSVAKLRKKNLADVVYWIGSPYQQFCDWFDNNIADKFRPEQIFILAPSVIKHSLRSSRSVSPIVKLQYHLSSKNYPVYVSDSMAEKPDDDRLLDFNLTQGKTVICSFHASKGCERDVVIVFNFDTTYFTYFAKSYDPSFCPNALYVALTRAKQKLILIQNNNLMFSFINNPLLSHFSQVLPSPNILSSQQSNYITPVPVIKAFGITKLIRQQNFLDSNFFSQFFSFSLSSQFPRCSCPLPSCIPGRFDDTFEDVADFNGNISTLYFQFLKTHSIPSFSNSDLQHLSLKHINNKINHSNLQIPRDLFYTLQISYVALHGYTHRLIQVKNWISQDHLDAIQQSFLHYFHPSNSQLDFQKPFSIRIPSSDFLSPSEIVHVSYSSFIISGQIDIIDRLNKHIIEIKYVRQLLPHHFLQLFFYYVLINLSNSASSFLDYSYYIFNIKSGQVFQLQINSDLPPFRQLFFRLIRSNILSSGPSISDQSFIDDISSYFNFVRSSDQLHLDLSSLNIQD